jgi:sugar transferase (PEP-CTERM/EpsH1 system associated)
MKVTPIDLLSRAEPHLVVHLVYSFGCGGLQTLLAECIDRLPAAQYRHAVVCLTKITDNSTIVGRADTAFFELGKPPGNDFPTHIKLWKLLRQLRPVILHTYNVGTLEYSLTAVLAGVPVRIHAEHGRDSVEIDGNHGRYNLLRRLLIPIVDAYVPVSADLAHWLRNTIRVPERKITSVTNGVDMVRYSPSRPLRGDDNGPLWIGTVGRADRIKNQIELLDSFQVLLERFPLPQHDLRLAIIGDGPMLGELRELVASKGLKDRVWMPGARNDIADVIRGFSIFVLPSLSEATPVVILEAMASGLPIVATRVGGVPDLVVENETGLLVAPSDPGALADAIATYVLDGEMRRRHGIAGRARIEAAYSIDAMIAGYASLYRAHMLRKLGSAFRHACEAPSQ